MTWSAEEECGRSDSFRRGRSALLPRKKRKLPRHTHPHAHAHAHAHTHTHTGRHGDKPELVVLNKWIQKEEALDKSFLSLTLNAKPYGILKKLSSLVHEDVAVIAR